MKLNLHVIRTNPNHIEQVEIEDVAFFTVDDNVLTLKFNTGEEEKIRLRDNSGEGIIEWSGVSIFATRIGLKVDMSK